MGDRSISAEARDAVVIERSLAEPQLFATVFERHFAAVHAYLARRVGSTRADDLTASTFTLAFERRQRFQRSADSARPWLLGIATNLLRNDWRAEKRALEALARLRPPVLIAAPSDDSDVSRVGEMLAALDSDQRDVLLLHAWEGLSYEEIAVALGIPVGTVRSRLARGRARLRVLLDAEGELGADGLEVSG